MSEASGKVTVFVISGLRKETIWRIQLSSGNGKRYHTYQNKQEVTDWVSRIRFQSSNLHTKHHLSGLGSPHFRRSIEEILKLLPGQHIETKRGALQRGSSLESLSGAAANVDKAAGGRRSVVLVVFIGGVTYAEISALRFLSSQELMAYDIIVATTKVINGQTLLEPFVETQS